MYYIGLDVHKKTISFCVKDAAGKIHLEGKIADCLRCDFLPECHMASTEIRNRRRILRYRGLVLRQA